MLLPTALALGAVAVLLGVVLFGILVETTRRLHTAQRERNSLRHRAALAQTLYDNPSVMVVVADRHGTITDCNQTVEAKLGYTRERLLGQKRTTDLYIDEDLREELASLFRETGAPVSGPPELARLRQESGARAVEREYTWLTAKGERLPISCTISPLIGEQGVLDGFVLTVHDLTERKAIERTARNRQLLIEQFVLHAPASIALFDRQLRYLAVSRRWLDDLRLGSSQVVGTPFIEDHSATARRWRDALKPCLEGIEQVRDEDTLMLADGSEQLIAWRCQPWYEANQTIGGVALHIEVLAEKRLTQRRLRESEARLKEAQALAHIGSWEFDLVARRLTWSEEAYRIHELPIGSPVTLEQIERFYAPNSRPVFRQALHQAVNHNQGWDFDAELETGQGRRIWVHTRGTVDVQAGRPVAIRCTLQDITERRRIEIDLSEARKEALAQARLKAEFLAAMSHELRTPLNAVIGMSHLLASTQLDDEQRECIQTVRGAGDTLLSVVNDILDFSKIESGKLELEQQPYTVTSCIEAAFDFVAARANEKGLELNSWVDPLLPPWLTGDITRVRQIVANLVGNAVKFTEKGEVFVSCRAMVGGDGRPSLQFTVRDTGIGIRREILPHLFHAYTQADVSIARTHGGTGLGLAICRRLVELMQGRIWAESEPNKGSSFHFQIPLIPAESPAPEQPFPAHALKGRRFLVVDDHPSALEVLQLHLEAWGAIAVPATGAMPALALLRRGEVFDGVIVDQVMPGMDGIAFARALEDQPTCPPLFLLAPIGQKATAIEQGIFQAVLTKPLKPQQLRTSLARTYALKEITAQLPSLPGAPDLQQSDPLRIRALIVDDNLINQSVARTLIEQLGGTAVIASSGAAALRQLRRETFDFVLMDLQMPELDGNDTTRRIRKELPVEQQPVVIAVTAYATAENRDSCLNAGMDDFLAKPLQVDTLGEVLRRWVEARRIDPSEIGD